MGRIVPAVARSADILELFLGGVDTLSMPEIISALSLPRATVHDLVSTLVARQYLAAVPNQPHRYRLGLRLFQLGSAYAERLDLVREANQVAADVSAVCEETVHVAVLDGTDVVYVAKADSTHSVRMVSAVGRRLPAHCTAVGKMLLANLTSAEFAERYPSGTRLQGMTRNSVTSTRVLKRQLTEVRERGLAFDDCESNASVACVAAPVRDHSGRVVAAMSISVPTVRWQDDVAEEWAQLIVKGADQFSARLGFNIGP